MSKKYDRRRCMERKKRHSIGICIAAAVGILMTGCGGAGNQPENENISAGETSSAQEQEAILEDGIYLVEFDTDSSMFHVNEACEGKGTLTVEDGQMTLHISLPSKNVVNLFPGLAEDAQKEGASLLQPTIDTVTYSDGMTEEVHGFDVPVPVLGEEFDLALLGTKGTWYDHKVSVSDPVMIEGESAPNDSGSVPEDRNTPNDSGSVPEDGNTPNDSGNVSEDGTASAHVDLEDGEYTINVTMEGGSGRASVASPATLIVTDGYADVRIEWSSPNYDYMKIGEENYTPVNTEGNSVFEIPIVVFDEKMEVIADTTAMGTPHEITYILTFYLDSVEKKTL